MNRRTMLVTGVSAAAFPFLSSCSQPANMTKAPSGPPPIPPVARREPHSITQLGHTRVDDYHWMKDDNWQNVMRDPSVLKPEIRAHLEAENAYREAMMAPTAALQETLY